MAGNEQHAEALRKAFPEAVKAECDGDGSWASITLPGETRPIAARCPGCQRAALLRKIGAFIPPRFSARIPVPEAVANWVTKGREAQGLCLVGQVGTGKTHTAWMALAEWCLLTGTEPWTPRSQGVEGWSQAGPTVIFTRMTDLLDDLRPGDGVRQRVRDCQHARLLVIDDLGAEKASEWTQERLYGVIDHRYVNCLPLIVTSNLPLAKLAEQTGERVASRLAEMCSVVPMTGTDRRRPAA